MLKMLKKQNNIWNKSIIAIGNGPSAISWKAGKIIDDFDIVVRFNNYEIEGYEDYVGSKTTYWVFNANKLVTQHRDYSQFEKVFVNCPARVIKERNDWLFDLKLLYPNIEFFQRPTIKKFQRRIDMPKWKNFSAGLSALCHLLLRNKCVYIHGFDNFEKYQNNNLKKNMKKTKHYFADKMIPYAGHSPSKEKEFVNLMIEKGKIQKLQESHSD